MELKKLRPLLLLCGVFLQTRACAQAQTADSTCAMHGCCCGANDPTPAGVMISHAHAKSEWMVSYRYMGMTMQQLTEGLQAKSETDVLETYKASPRFMQMQMHMLMAMYGVTDKLTCMAMFQYTFNYMDMMMLMGKRYYSHNMLSSGLSDTKLYALYALRKNKSKQLLVSFGINIPTGSIQRKGAAGAMMYDAQRLPYSMQLGSGTYDFLPGVNYLVQRNKMSYSAQVTAVLRAHYNALSYRYGNELTASAWAAWQWLSFINNSLRVEGSVAGKIKGKDQTLNVYEEPSANPGNYGGERLTVYIGTSFRIKKGFLDKNRLSIEYGLPVYQNLNGIQMKTKSGLYAAWSLTF